MKELQFYYFCLLTYCKTSGYELSEIGTDSFYIAISGNTSGDIIKPNKRRCVFVYISSADFQHNLVNYIEKVLLKQNILKKRGILFTIVV